MCSTKAKITVGKKGRVQKITIAFNNCRCCICGGVVPKRHAEALERLNFEAFKARFQVPLWVTAASAGVISLGTALGGWRIIRTLGGKFYKVRPVHGFTAQIASTTVILGAALLGGPVSTTHVVSSAILGVGSAERVSKVRWGVAGNIVAAWGLTIPASALLAALAYLALRQLAI